MTRAVLAMVGGGLFLLGALGAFSGMHDHVRAGFGLNGNQNALHVLTGLAAMMLAAIGPGAARAGSWILALGFSLLFIGGAAGSNALAEAFNFNAANHLLHLAIAAGGVWAATYRPIQQEADELLDLELEFEGQWPQEDGRRPGQVLEEPVGTGSSRMR